MAWRSRPRGKSPSRSAVLTLSVCQDRLQGVFKPQSVSGTGSPLTRMLPARGAQFENHASRYRHPEVSSLPRAEARVRKSTGISFFPLWFRKTRELSLYCICMPTLGPRKTTTFQGIEQSVE